VGRDGVVGQPDLPGAGRRADEAAQPVAPGGIRRRGRQPEHDAVGRVVLSAAPTLGDGGGDGGDRVSLQVAHPFDLHDAIVQGVPEPDAGLPAVNAQHAGHATAAIQVDASIRATNGV